MFYQLNKIFFGSDDECITLFYLYIESKELSHSIINFLIMHVYVSFKKEIRACTAVILKLFRIVFIVTLRWRKA